MNEINNAPNYLFEMLPGQDGRGQHILSVLVKRTYDLRREEICAPSEEQMEFVVGDQFFDNGDPVTTSCELESDFIPYKTATDVVLIGKAYAPRRSAVDRLDVTLEIGSHRKTIRVIGDRQCKHRVFRDPLFSDPVPFETMELRYERAYGGVDVHSQEGGALIYPRNPIGRGFVVKDKKEAVEGLMLPNLEDPRDLLTPERIITEKMANWVKQPMPQSFGWYSKSWYPRASFAGVMPADTQLYEMMREASLGFVPEDQVESFKKLKMPMMDFKFFNGASPGLALPYLKGNETVKLINMDPDGDFFFQLPGDLPKVMIDLGEGFQEPEVVLHTVCILKEEGVVYLVWRGAVEYPGPEHMQELKNLEIKVEG